MPEKIITITMDGGLIQSVDHIPPGILVKVIDFDIEGADPETIITLPGGRACVAEYRCEYGEQEPTPQSVERNVRALSKTDLENIVLGMANALFLDRVPNREFYNREKAVGTHELVYFCDLVDEYNLVWPCRSTSTAIANQQRKEEPQ